VMAIMADSQDHIEVHHVILEVGFDRFEEFNADQHSRTAEDV